MYAHSKLFFSKPCRHFAIIGAFSNISVYAILLYFVKKFVVTYTYWFAISRVSR